MTAVVIVLLLVLLQVAVIGAMTSAARQADVTINAAQGAQSFYAAEGAVQRGIRELVKGSDEDGNGTIGTVTAPSGMQLASMTVTTTGNSKTVAVSLGAGDARRTSQATVTITPANNGPLLAEYWQMSSTVTTLANVPWTTAPSSIGVLRHINFASISDSIEPLYMGGGTAGRWAMRVTGNITITTAGTYTFYTESDDGSDLTINGTKVVNNDGAHGPTTKSGTLTLAAGAYPFVLRFFENSGGHMIRAYWLPPSSTPGVTQALIPPTVLSGTGSPQGVCAVTSATMSLDCQILTWTRSGTASGPALVCNSTAAQSITLSDRAKITGDVKCGVGANTNAAIKTFNNSQILGVQSAQTTATGISRASGAYSPAASSGAYSLTNQSTATLGPGSYTYTSMSLAADSVLNISGYTIIQCNGAFSMQDRAQIILGSGATLMLYVDGNITLIHDSKLNNDSSKSQSLIVVQTGASRTFTMQDRAIMCGLLRTPRGSVSMIADTVFYGNIETNTLSMTDRAKIFADVTPSSSNATGTVKFTGWSELQSSN